MTVAELLERVSSAELAEWMAFFRVEASEMEANRDVSAKHRAAEKRAREGG